MTKLNSRKTFLGTLLVGITCCTSCSNEYSNTPYVDNNTYYHESYRPSIHFSPEKFWMNDPNGLVYLDGEYHLFYQYNPQASIWGNMSWGHAVSTDLIHWTNLPVALTPDKDGAIFSGSAVIDKDNTAGFGANAMVAIYTLNGAIQSQCIAYSTDKGRTFTKYASNPVIANDGSADFRDPNVFWYDANKCWIMTLATGQTVTFYTSKDLKAWTKLSVFGHDMGAHGGVWECPNLFPLTYNGQQKWVLTVSLNPGAPNGGSGTQYFIGSFDGTTFSADNEPYPLWLDYGKDNYAGITWNNIPATDGRRLGISWMSNWDYAGAVPTMAWRNAVSLPKELTLQTGSGDYPVLASNFVKEMDALSTDWSAITPVANVYSLGGNENQAYQLNIDLSIPDAQRCELTLSNDSDEYYTIIIDRNAGTWTADRTHSGNTSFSSNFSSISTAPLNVNSTIFSLSLVVDNSSIESIMNGGMSQQTNLVFPSKLYNKIKIVGNGTSVSSVKVRHFNSIW